MYLNRWVLLLSCIVGVFGAVALAITVNDYRSAVRTYTQIDVAHTPESLAWQDGGISTNERLAVELIITNRSPTTVTIEYLQLQLYADGEFAGATYDGWQPFAIAEGDRANHAAHLEVAISSLRESIGYAELSLRGEVRLRFAGIERPLTRSIRMSLGRVQTTVDREP